METEIWGLAKDYGGYYEVSTFGNVRRIKVDGFGRRCSIGRNLRPQKHPKGYLLVFPSVHGIQRGVTVHSLVAGTHIGKRPSGKEVNHKDGNKTNNALWNLEYKTPIGNMRHAEKTGLLGHSLDKGKVAEIRKIGRSMRQVDIAKRFGVSQVTIGLVLRKKTWRYF